MQKDSSHSNSLDFMTLTTNYKKGKGKLTPMSKNLSQTPKTAAIVETITIPVVRA